MRGNHKGPGLGVYFVNGNLDRTPDEDLFLVQFCMEGELKEYTSKELLTDVAVRIR